MHFCWIQTAEFIKKNNNLYACITKVIFFQLEYPVFEDPTAITTIYMASGETRNLPCNATGSPPPSVSLKKQQPILTRSGSRDRRNLMKLNGRFTISNAALEDFGVYECRASNGLGSITKQINVANGGTVRLQYPYVWLFIILIIIYIHHLNSSSVHEL